MIPLLIALWCICGFIGCGMFIYNQGRMTAIDLLFTLILAPATGAIMLLVALIEFRLLDIVLWKRK